MFFQNLFPEIRKNISSESALFVVLWTASMHTYSLESSFCEVIFVAQKNSYVQASFMHCFILLDSHEIVPEEGL